MTQQTSLYVPADEAGMVALNREWWAARIVFVVGFVIAIGFVAWWTTSHGPVGSDGGDVYAASPDAAASQDQMDDAIASGQTSKEGFMLCRLAIGTAENFGVVPNTMRYESGPAKTDVRGRYVCIANDKGGVRYSLTLDLVCSNLNNASCGNVVTITKADGTVLFHRQDNDQATPEASTPQATDSGNGTSAPADAPTAPTETGAPPQ